jgi:hypothetical protein
MASTDSKTTEEAEIYGKGFRAGLTAAAEKCDAIASESGWHPYSRDAMRASADRIRKMVEPTWEDIGVRP